MRAAIYARKSNDDRDGRAEEDRSITRQRERAIAYAQAKGWTVDPEHVFEDDGISGAEFERRYGLLKLLARLKEFDVVVTSELSRLGRDTVRTPVVIDDIRTGGVRIFYYLTDDEEKADTPEAQVMVSLKSFGAAMERAKIAERTRDALSRKAEKGLSAGGRCFGYDNVWKYPDGREVVAPEGIKKEDPDARTDWRTNDEQAAVVKAIFTMYAAGHGCTTIAKALNNGVARAEKDTQRAQRRMETFNARYRRLNERYFGGHMPPSPQHGEQGTGSWSPSSVRAILYRRRYAGQAQYGEYRNVRNGGRVGKCVKQDKFIVFERKDLRIVPPELWDKVQARLKAVRETYIKTTGGKFWSRPETGRESRFLLSAGMARCGCKNGKHVCGRSIVVVGGQKREHYYYQCGFNNKRSSSVCANDLRVKMATMDELVLGEIERKVLTPEAVEFVVEEAMREYKALCSRRPDELPRIESEIKKLRRELANYNRLIAGGRAPKSVLVEIETREAKIAALTKEVDRYRTPVDLRELDLRRKRKEAREHIGRFKDLVFSDVPKARQALRKLLRDKDGNFAPLYFAPAVRDGRKTFEIQGAVTVAPLFNKIGTEERT